MDCEQEQVFQRLVKVSKYLFPSLIVISYLFYYAYQHSLDLVEIKVIDKNIEWASHCTDFDCTEFEVFTVQSEEETFTTTGQLFGELTIGNSYFVSSKGWKVTGGKRKLTEVY